MTWPTADRRAAYAPWASARTAVGLAMDRSVRTFDADGRLRVATAVLTSACVSRYLTEEIPNWRALGLAPGGQYNLLRPADELRRALPGFNNLPLLDCHIPVSATDHRPDNVIGATGSDAAMNGDDLSNSLIVWAQSGIDLIESGEARSLSCGYAYTPVRRSGIFGAQNYDLVMTDIIPNHVALVPDGRVAGAVVGDENPFGRTGDMADMAKLREFLRGKLGSADYETVCAMLGDDTGQMDLGMDDPPAFSGRPRAGGSMDPIAAAMDAARVRVARAKRIQAAGVRLAERFPNINRLAQR
jgi:hypothetical protein